MLAFSIHHVKAETILTQYQKFMDQIDTFEMGRNHFYTVQMLGTKMVIKPTLCNIYNECC